MAGCRALVALAAMLLAATAAAVAAAATIVVAPSGGDFVRVQDALDAAQPGDTVRVRAGIYRETVVFRRGGLPGAPIVLEAWPGEQAVLDGSAGPGPDLVRIDDLSHLQVRGLELRGLRGVTDGSGIRVTGAGTAITLEGNRIHDLRGRNAMGITVYGTRAASISDLAIVGNEIVDCDPAPSEALTVNGNVDGFVIAGNTVRDVNNIGIDAIGGERDIQPDPTLVARHGTIRDNRVLRARSSYGGGYAAGIYVDGGRDIVVERNLVSESDLGIEIGAENRGIVTRNVHVRDNVLWANDKACLVFGGYAASRGRVRDSAFTHNTCWGNDTLRSGNGELWIQYAEDNVVSHNIFHATAAGLLLSSWRGNAGNVLDRNLWFTSGSPRFVWNGTTLTGLAAFQSATGQEADGLFADPRFVDPTAGNYHLAADSPAIDAGAPGFVPGPGETDVDGGPRVSGLRVDLGADEATRCGDGILEIPELCDDGNLDSGDGCDANCTLTGCGNGIVTPGEACDDGNLASGDCCDASCALEAAGAPCDDGDACTQSDQCASGTCQGRPEPALSCRMASRAVLQLDTSRTRLVWRWTSHSVIPGAELGDPVRGGTRYTLCLYDMALHLPTRAFSAVVRPGPRWQARGGRGYRYRDPLALDDGLQTLVLGPTRMVLKGRGSALPLPALPLDQDPEVVAQLHASTGACWSSRYASPAQRNDAVQFRDRMD